MRADPEPFFPDWDQDLNLNPISDVKKAELNA